MPFIIVLIILQVALVVHIVKTGRDTTWIWIVVMLPLAGAIAYVLLEVLPSMGQSRAGQGAKRKVSELVNPDKDLKSAVADLSVADNVASNMRLAEECMNKKMFEEAKTLFERCLKGVHLHDPEILLGLAQAEFELGHYEQVKYLLDELKEHNPDYANSNAHLLYARTVEASGDINAAIHEYEALHGYAPGPEIIVRYAQLLQKAGRNREANELCSKLLNDSSIAGKHHKSLHARWLKKAKQKLG